MSWVLLRHAFLLGVCIAPFAVGQVQGWDAVSQAIEEFTDIPDAVVRVGTASNELVFEHVKGTEFTADSQIMFASATKLLSATAIMTLVEQGTMFLTDRPSDYLAWWTKDPNDKRSQITLAHLLSFTSGLNGGDGLTSANDACISDRQVGWEDCLKAIYDNNDPPSTDPGTTFVYGSTHLQVAGGMAVAATGSSDYNALLKKQVWDPLGVATTDLTVKVTPLSNPRVAGGLALTSMKQYGQFLRGYFLKTLLGPTTLAAMEADHTPTANVTIGYTANPPAHYGFGNWLDCPSSQPVWGPSCAAAQLHSSAGLFGFMPWVDRANQYYAYIGRQDTTANAAATKSMLLAKQLQPLIAAALKADPGLNHPDASTGGPETSPTSSALHEASGQATHAGALLQACITVGLAMVFFSARWS